MLFNFKLFSNFVVLAYRDIEHNLPLGQTYSLKEVLDIFWHYFKLYECTFGEQHPNIRPAQIRRIIEAMPYIDEYGGGDISLDPDDYEALIDAHFQTQYRSCDYNINHFFSGDIRLMRYYENLY